MTNKLYDSKGQLIGYIRTVEKNLHDDLTRVILSTGHELAFCPGDLTSDRDGNWRIRSGALYPRCEGKKTASATNTAAIKDVIFCSSGHNRLLVGWFQDRCEVQREGCFRPGEGAGHGNCKALQW